MDEYARGWYSFGVYVYSVRCVDSFRSRSMSESKWFAFTYIYSQLWMWLCAAEFVYKSLAMAKLGAMSLLSFAVQYKTTRFVHSLCLDCHRLFTSAGVRVCQCVCWMNPEYTGFDGSIRAVCCVCEHVFVCYRYAMFRMYVWKTNVLNIGAHIKSAKRNSST